MGDVSVMPSGKRQTGGGGPEDPMLELRVAALETAVAQIESKVDRISDALRRIEDALKALADASRALVQQNADLAAKVAHIDGRVSNIPTTWQTIAILSSLLIGISAIVFTASRFLHP